MMTLVRGDWFFILLIVIDSLFMARPYIYAVQQDNYRIGALRGNRRLMYVYLIDLAAATLFALIWTLFYFLQARAFWGFVTAMFFFITEFALYFMEDLPDKKKPLKYTKRAVRGILITSLAGVLLETMLFAYMNANVDEVYMRYLIFFAYPIAYPLIFCITLSAVNLFERLNNLRYERRARNVLRSRPDLIKIAVTGSYGKTSVKNALKCMLEKKYSVLATPESYNTPLGIARTLASLTDDTEVFIAEMGARRRKDIKRLMEIVEPTDSILTGINTQHLATFKTEENIIREKTKVITMLRGDGCCVAGVSARSKIEGILSAQKRVRVPVYVGTGDCDAVISDTAVCENGSVFTLTLDGESYTVYTPLLGAHNIENVAVAAAMAYGIGVDMADILAAAAELEGVPHRMQLIDGSGIRIIDDTFNSNPDGAGCALEVLSMFSGRKVIVTPGLVELGSAEYNENYKLGERISSVCDAVMLIGRKRTEPIRRALRQTEFKGEIRVYDSLKAAEEDFKNTLHVGDTLLLLNDLPDCYDE